MTAVPGTLRVGVLRLLPQGKGGRGRSMKVKLSSRKDARVLDRLHPERKRSRKAIAAFALRFKSALQDSK